MIAGHDLAIFLAADSSATRMKQLCGAVFIALGLRLVIAARR